MGMSDIASWGGLALAFMLTIFLALQTLRLGRVEKQFRALTRGAGSSASSMSLGELIASQGERLEATRDEVQALHGAVTGLNTAVSQSIKRVGLVRYNPFQETGGDQSFSLALLDSRGDGVVVSSLHGRTATRFYAKPVKNGASPASLSDEEVQALRQAMEQT